MQPSAELSNEVRLHVMRQVIETGQVPKVHDTALALGQTPEEVRRAHQWLAEAHVFVLEPGSFELRMANPFSAIPTPFEVSIGGRKWWGNCIWDAMGIAATLKAEARISTRCPDCAYPLSLTVSGAAVSGDSGIVHFAVPAAQWWNDIIFT